MTETIKTTAKKPTIHDRLAVIQKELKAPKNQFNKFGNFNYRSCEDILEAVKPLLKSDVLTLNDEIVQVGDRYYVKATAGICGEDGLGVFVSAYAREADTKAGMDVAQITGAASSYARKYALNGLFLIDDTKDADTQDNTKETPVWKQKAEAILISAENNKAVASPVDGTKSGTAGTPTTTVKVSPSLRQIEAVVKIAKQNGEEILFSEVQEKWTAQQASDYISKKGNGGYYKAKETK